MQPSWLHEMAGFPRTDGLTTVGVAICVSDYDVPLIHAGVVYGEAGQSPRLLHLAFHANVRLDVMPSDLLAYYWTPIPIDPDRAVSLVGFCRRVAKRRPRIPYGIVYDEGRLTDDGLLELSGRTIGLTCATFVLAVLRWAGYELLDLKTWEPRAEDAVWHGHIVEMLRALNRDRPELITEEHVAAVVNEKHCARFRPEEVAAACPQHWPVAFAQAEPEGAVARAFLLSEPPLVAV